MGLDFKIVELEGKYLPSGVKKEKDIEPLTLTIRVASEWESTLHEAGADGLLIIPFLEPC